MFKSTMVQHWDLHTCSRSISIDRYMETWLYGMSSGQCFGSDRHIMDTLWKKFGLYILCLHRINPGDFSEFSFNATMRYLSHLNLIAAKTPRLDWLSGGTLQIPTTENRVGISHFLFASGTRKPYMKVKKGICTLLVVDCVYVQYSKIKWFTCVNVIASLSCYHAG